VRRGLHKRTISIANVDLCNDTIIGTVDEGEVTLEYVQRLEDEIAEKGKQIKLIKQKLINDSRRNSPVRFCVNENRSTVQVQHQHRIIL